MTASASALSTLRELAQAATPGPWMVTGTAAKPHWYVSSPECLVHGPALVREADTVQENIDRRFADARFIAAARNEVEALLDQLDAAQDALQLADAALLAYKAQAEFWVPEADAAIAAARARQEEP